MILELIETVHLMGFDKDDNRIAEKDYRVSFPIDESSFNSLPSSEAFKMRGNWGTVLVETIPKHKRQRMEKRTFEPPPRYIELGHSSFIPNAPMETIAEESL